MTNEHIRHLRQIANSCKRNLPTLCQERLQRLKEFKSSILINTECFKLYGCSDYIKLSKFLKDLEEDPKMPLPMAIDVRDCLMLTLCVTNCLRSSNLMNVTIHDFEQAKKHEEIENAYTFTSTKYKTSLVYGAKIILVSRAVYMQLKIYSKKVETDQANTHTRRNQIPKGKSCDSYLHHQPNQKTEFLGQMKHSLVTQCLTRTFEKSKVFAEAKDRYKSVSPSRIRFSVLTELIALGDERLDNVAHCFVKLGTEVSKRKLNSVFF